MTALTLLALLLTPACLEEPQTAADAAAVPGQPGPPSAQPRPGQPQSAVGNVPPAKPGSLPPLNGDSAAPKGPASRSPGPLKVALVPSSRAVLLYKALVTHEERKDNDEKGNKVDRGGEGGPGEKAAQDERRDAIIDVRLLMPQGQSLVPLGTTRVEFRQAVGTYADPIRQSSGGLERVQLALLAGETDCGVLPAAVAIDLADGNDGSGQTLVLLAQLGSAGGNNTDLAVVVRKGVSTSQVPDAARTGATEGLDARLLLSGLVQGQHQVLGDDSLVEALAAGTVDFVVAPDDLVRPAVEAGTAVSFRALTQAEAAPSAQVLVCRVSTLGNVEAREALKALLRVHRGYLKRRGAEDPTAIGGHYPKNARVDVAVLKTSLATLKAQELVSNAALEIVDLQALEEAGTPPQGPLGASAVLVDNRLVASRGGEARNGGGGDGLELPPPPE